MLKQMKPWLIQDHIFTFYSLVLEVVLQSIHSYISKLRPNVD